MSCLKWYGDLKNMFYFMIMIIGNKKKYIIFIILIVLCIINYDLLVYKFLKFIWNFMCK